MRISNCEFGKTNLLRSFLVRIFRPAALVICCCAMTAATLAQSGGTQQNLTGRGGTFAITNARIVTVTGETIENGTVLIRDGKIAAVGTTVAIDRGVEVIDGKGLSVYPGMIDAATNMGLREIAGGAAGTVDIAETGNMNSNAKAILGVNPHSAHINVTRVNGITTLISMPTSGLISGQAAVIDLNGSTQAEMALIPEFALVVNFPRIVTFGGFDPGVGRRIIDFSTAVKQRDKNIEDLKKIFEDSSDYARAKEAAAKDPTLPAHPFDLKMDAMIPYVRGIRPIIFTADSERDIRGMIKFAEEMKLKAILLGGAEAWKAADELKKNNIPVIFDKMWSTPQNRDDDYDSLYSAPSKMAKAGIQFCIGTGDDGPNIRDLPYQAGMSAAFGLTPDEALKAVTIYPARILGLEDRIGSIEVGKIANVVVTDGDILDPRTNIRYLFIDGKMLPLTSRHTELYEAFKNRK